MDKQRLREQSQSFGQAAELYDRVRPHYAPQALHWVLGGLTRGPSDGTRGPSEGKSREPDSDSAALTSEFTTRGVEAADLGAGTGILTRQLIGLGCRCVAVEPDRQMREQCAARLTSGGRTNSAQVMEGTAEAIPLPDHSLDVVFAGQAYHWFDVAKAHPEIARVLRPGGIFAPIWNIRDESEPWVAQLTKLIQSNDGTGAHAGWRNPPLGEHFSDVRQQTFRHAVRHTPGSLRDLLHSRSYYLTESAAGRATLDRDMGDLLANHPQLSGRDEFDLPYLTVAYQARRR